MWYCWRSVDRAEIPTELRAEFERLGESVVTQLAGNPTIGAMRGIERMHPWAVDDVGHQQALAWLREQGSRRERREDIREAIEVAILVLVAIEAIPILIHTVRQC